MCYVNIYVFDSFHVSYVMLTSHSFNEFNSPCTDPDRDHALEAYEARDMAWAVD